MIRMPSRCKCCLNFIKYITMFCCFLQIVSLLKFSWKLRDFLKTVISHDFLLWIILFLQLSLLTPFCQHLKWKYSCPFPLNLTLTSPFFLAPSLFPSTAKLLKELSLPTPFLPSSSQSTVVLLSWFPELFPPNAVTQTSDTFDLFIRIELSGPISSFIKCSFSVTCYSFSDSVAYFSCLSPMYLCFCFSSPLIINALLGRLIVFNYHLHLLILKVMSLAWYYLLAFNLSPCWFCSCLF